MSDQLRRHVDPDSPSSLQVALTRTHFVGGLRIHNLNHSRACGKIWFIESNALGVDVRLKCYRPLHGRSRWRTLIISCCLQLRLPLVALVHECHCRSDGCLGNERNCGKYESLSKHRLIDLRICEQRHPGVEGVAQRIHHPDYHGAFLGICAADFIGPTHA